MYNKVLLCFLIVGMVSCEYNKDEPALKPETVSFSTDVQPIFTAKCVSCHGGSTNPNLSAGNAYNALTSNNKYIDLQNPENSYFYQKISTGSMAQYLNDKDRAIILRWIELGAQNNK